jgi:hypothetical protein
MRYEQYKKAWHNIKPIRGRSPDTRPIGKRRRDWEQIVRMVDANGVESYGAKLYNTVCVEYFPDGSILLRSGGWVTPSTAAFISDHSPFGCWKQNNNLWVRRTNDDLTLPLGNELRFTWDEQKGYICPEMPVIKKSVIDREKAKAARAPLKPFLNFARAFLTLSDGWVMHETCKEAFGWDAEGAVKGHHGYRTSFRNDRDLFEMIYDEPDEEQYLKVLCVLSRMKRDRPSDVRVAEKFTQDNSYEYNGVVRTWTSENRFYDIRMYYDDVKQIAYKWVDRFMDVRKQIEVAPGKKAMAGVLDIVK